MSMSKGLRVYHKMDPPYSLLLEARNKAETLILESGVIAVLSAQQTEAIRRSYTKLIDAYGCLGVLNLPYARNSPVSYLILVTSCVSVGKINTADIYRISSVTITPLQTNTQDDSKIGELKKFLSSGTFYFSLSADPNCNFDLSICAQNRKSHGSGDDDHEDDRFFWNKTLHLPVKQFGIDCKTWLLKVMCGGVEVRTIYASQRQGRACLISRLSCERVGTRFNVRGVNDEGNVANFVETEQVIYIDDAVSSHIQVRGSVPLFWEQPGFQVGSHKVKMSRGYEASSSAFKRHFCLMHKLYGDHVIVNLLGSKESEQILSSTFKNQHGMCKPYNQSVPFISFDYHYECRGGNLKNLFKLKNIINKHFKPFGVFFSHPSVTPLETTQTGCFRVNCLDCLDRTNSVQTMIGLEILQKQLELLGLADKAQMKSRFEEVYKSMWSINGDHLSRIYAGTGALGGGRSRAQDAARSANRTLQNNFLDSTKQEAIDLLVKGGCLEGVEMNDRIHTLYPSPNLQLPIPVIQRTLDSICEYTTCKKIRISVGTWNVNGGKHFRSIAFKHEEVTDWLLDLPPNNTDLLLPGVDYSKPSDIFAIGFEEIVDLNAGNIVSASTQNQKDWGVHLQKSLSRTHPYVILTSVQLVGVCLFVFVRPRLAEHIKNLAICSVKTGMGGTTGNKGGVGIRFQLFNSSMCFVCSHFAAGQSNVKERNNDFHDISNRISFPMNRKAWNHDHIFYCGDFNYRIDMIKDDVKELVGLQDWSKLLSADQLTVQRLAGNVFQGFKEGPIKFAPTYKYDLFCDDYDTSEKCRVPAWTDRVLWTSRMFKETSDNACKLLFYHRSELKTSDHRPVLAIYEASVLKSHPVKRWEILNRCLHDYGPTDCCVVVGIVKGGVGDGENEEEDEDPLEDHEVDRVLALLALAGDVVLVRFISNTSMLVTFKNGSQALNSLQFNQYSDEAIYCFTLSVSVYDKDWLTKKKTNVLKSDKLLVDESMYSDDDDEDGCGGGGGYDEEDAVTESQKEANLLLSFEGEDPEVMAFTKDPSGLSASSIDLSYSSPKHRSLSSSGHLSVTPIPRNAITPTLSTHRGTITMPTSSSMGTMKDITLNDGDDDDGDDDGGDDDGEDDDNAKNEVSLKLDQKLDKVKPPRPSNLPSRPPPPKLNNNKSKNTTKIHIVKPFFQKSSKRVSSIGIPTNVTKISTKDVDEAERMISHLMNKSGTLPPNQHPPLPSAPRPNVKQSSLEKGKSKQSTWYTLEADKTPKHITQPPLPPPQPLSQNPQIISIPPTQKPPTSENSVSNKPVISDEPLLLLDHSDIPTSLHSPLDPFSPVATQTPVPATRTSQKNRQQDLLGDFSFGEDKVENTQQDLNIDPSLTFRQAPLPPSKPLSQPPSLPPSQLSQPPSQPPSQLSQPPSQPPSQLSQPPSQLSQPPSQLSQPPSLPPSHGTPSCFPLIPCRPAPVLDRNNLHKQQQQQVFTTDNIPNTHNTPPIIPARANISQQNFQPQSLPQLQKSPPQQYQPPQSLPHQPPIPQRQPPLPQRQLPQPLLPSRPPNIPPRKI